MEKRDIEIRRNIIEKALMAVKDYARKNYRVVLYASVGLLVAFLLVIGAVLYYDKRATDELVKFEQILDVYRKSFSGEPAERIKSLDKTAGELDILVGRSWWGYVHNNGYYVIGGLYYNERRYPEAKKYYLKSVERNSRSFFSPLALQQAARSSEYMGDYKDALKLYTRMEKEYAGSVVGDQIYYDLGCIYEHEGDIFKARENLNKVITSYPRSPFAQKAKEKLFLLGSAGKKE